MARQMDVPNSVVGVDVIRSRGGWTASLPKGTVSEALRRTASICTPSWSTTLAQFCAAAETLTIEVDGNCSQSVVPAGTRWDSEASQDGSSPGEVRITMSRGSYGVPMIGSMNRGLRGAWVV